MTTFSMRQRPRGKLPSLRFYCKNEPGLIPSAFSEYICEMQVDLQVTKCKWCTSSTCPCLRTKPASTSAHPTCCYSNRADHQQLLLEPGEHRVFLRWGHHQDCGGRAVLCIYARRERSAGSRAVRRFVQHAAEGGKRFSLCLHVHTAVFFFCPVYVRRSGEFSFRISHITWTNALLFRCVRGRENTKKNRGQSQRMFFNNLTSPPVTQSM